MVDYKVNGRRPSEAVARARALLDGLGGKPLNPADAAAAAVQVAALVWEAAEARRTDDERRHSELLSRLMDDPVGQAFSNLVADRAYRSHDAQRLVAQTQHLLEALGTPRYLAAMEKLQLNALRAIGSAFPKAVARGMRRTLRQKTRAVILSSREPGLSEHLVRRRDEGVRMNLNWLGEAVLGEGEAERRVEQYTELLARPEVEAVSVKVSTLTSQLRLLAWDATLQRLRPQLRTIYRAALRHGRRGPEGRPISKLVNLDMEAYRDLHVTADLFCSVLDEPEFRELTAGIALQAYLPDSFPLQRELTAWARARVANGGAPIRLRIVKGANLAAERVEASLRGWTVPIYRSKDEVDGNFKRMLAFGCCPENVRAVHLGIASHNVFDLAYAMTLRAQRRVQESVGFELLEGMADHLQRTIREVAGDVLLYGPVVDERAMQTAIAYLIRRLDENTAEHNFLRRSFAMRVGDLSWHAQRRRFLRTCRRSRCVSSRPLRQQDRNLPAVASPQAGFGNEPDTDFALAGNREWIRGHLDRCSALQLEVPMQIAATTIHRRPLADGFDPSRPGARPYTHPLATETDIERALAAAQHAVAEWTASTPADRAQVMAGIAQRLRVARGELIAAIVLDAGKRVEEADAEVSEAIDFAEYYRRCSCELYADRSVRVQPKGVALVTPPWNFPLAIPAGSTLAALAAGNSVMLKPALETPLVAERFARICWEAGVPRQVLQLILCTDKVGSRLVADPRVNLALLTGATSTAQLFSELHPGLHLTAETGGKNPIIITDMSDRDAAIQAAVWSAFGHAGQKCSAASLLICESAVYDDPDFRETLRDAAASLPVGSAWDPDSVVTPLIHPPQRALLRGLTQLERGETWLLQPRSAPHNPRLWSPGIKLGVREGSFTHTTELFGPVLGVMRAANLAEAVRMANATPYGLTAGLQSLDEREQLFWLEHMHAGNLYVNRGRPARSCSANPSVGTGLPVSAPARKPAAPTTWRSWSTSETGSCPRPAARRRPSSTG